MEVTQKKKEIQNKTKPCSAPCSFEQEDKPFTATVLH